MISLRLILRKLKMKKTLDNILITFEKLTPYMLTFMAGVSTTKAYEAIQERNIANSFYLSGMTILFLAASYWETKHIRRKNAG